MRGVTHDVTARKLAEERFRTLVEAAPSAMLVVDADGVIVLCQRPCRDDVRVCARRPGRALGGRAGAGTLSDSHDAHRQAYRQEWRPRAMGAGRELFASRKDGTELPVEVGLNPDADFRGQLRDRLRGRRQRAQAQRAGGGAPARRDGAPGARGDAGRAVRLARARAEPAAVGDSQQCAGGTALSCPRPASARPGDGDPRATSSRATSGPARSSPGCARCCGRKRRSTSRST